MGPKFGLSNSATSVLSRGSMRKWRPDYRLHAIDFRKVPEGPVKDKWEPF